LGACAPAYLVQGPTVSYAAVKSRQWATLVHAAEAADIAAGVHDLVLHATPARMGDLAQSVAGD
jgi:hypothetical protein